MYIKQQTKISCVCNAGCKGKGKGGILLQGHRGMVEVIFLSEAVNLSL